MNAGAGSFLVMFLISPTRTDTASPGLLSVHEKCKVVDPAELAVHRPLGKGGEEAPHHLPSPPLRVVDAWLDCDQILVEVRALEVADSARRVGNTESRRVQHLVHCWCVRSSPDDCIPYVKQLVTVDDNKSIVALFSGLRQDGVE